MLSKPTIKFRIAGYQSKNNIGEQLHQRGDKPRGSKNPLGGALEVNGHPAADAGGRDGGGGRRPELRLQLR